MTALDPLLHFASELARRLMSTHDEGVLRGLITDMRDAFGVDGASVVVLDGTALHVATSPVELASLERLQHRLSEGPNHRAATSGRLVAISDLAEQRTAWPTYVALSSDAGMRATLSLPLLSEGGVPNGAVTLYAANVRRFNEVEVTLAQLTADLISGFLTNARTFRSQEETARHLQTALDSRVRIEQAKGILAEVAQIGLDEAFDRIREYARSRQLTIAAVADQVVNHGLRPRSIADRQD